MYKNIKYFTALIIVLGSSSSAFCSDFSERDMVVAAALRKSSLAEICNGNGKDKTYPILLTVLQYCGTDIGYKALETQKDIDETRPNFQNNDEIPLDPTFNMLACRFSTKRFGWNNWITWRFPKNYTFDVLEFQRMAKQPSEYDYVCSLCGSARLKIYFDSKEKESVMISLEELALSDAQYNQQCNDLLHSTHKQNCMIL